MERIDLFPTNFQFNFKSKDYFSTGFSQSLSMLLIIISLFTFFWNLSNMFLKHNLSINSYWTDITIDDKVVFNETNSFLGFSILDKFDNIIEENSGFFKYLTINSNLVSSELFSDLPKNKLELVNCNQTLNKDFFNSSKYNITTCIDFNNSLTLGNFYSPPVNLFELSVVFDFDTYIKDNNSIATNDLLCFIIIYFPISSYNLNNFTNPYNISVGWNYYSINFNQSKTYLMSYVIDEIHTDRGYLKSDYYIDKIVSKI